MEQHRCSQIEQLFHSVKEQGPARIHAFLTEVCRDDEELRREIESLLARDTSRDCLLDRPPADLMGDSTASLFAARLRPHPLDPFVPGTVLGGRFRILRAAGAGGMGFVYEALDEKLHQRDRKSVV